MLLRGIFLALFLLSSASGSTLAAGAIAVDDEEGLHPDDIGWGASTGESSTDAARNAALHQCRAASNTNCTVIVTFDTCGAYAVSYRHSGVGWGRTEAQAVSMALDECGPNCRVVVSQCE